MNHFRQTYAEIERLLDESETQDEFAKASDQLFDFEAILAKLVSTEPEKNRDAGDLDYYFFTAIDDLRGFLKEKVEKANLCAIEAEEDARMDRVFGTYEEQVSSQYWWSR